MKPLRQFRPFKLIGKETLTEGSEDSFPIRRFTFELPEAVSPKVDVELNFPRLEVCSAFFRD